MNTKALIDAIIRQTTVLIAQLATTAGLRAPLAHVANQVFLELSKELEAQGVGKKVAADMFGLALRSYQLKVQRLMESETDEQGSLWEAVFEFIREKDGATQGEILGRFYNDSEQTVRGILRDLVDSSLVFRTGRGTSAYYRPAEDEDLLRVLEHDDVASATALVWIMLYRLSPVSRQDLIDQTSIPPERVDKALSALLSEGRIYEEEVLVGEDDDEQTRETVYHCEACIIPMSDPAGWEAALFDHFQAMVRAVCVKLREGRLGTLPADVLGGSTYSFDVWDGHPYEKRVLGLLKSMREQVSELRADVTAYNQQQRSRQISTSSYEVNFYCGQSVVIETEREQEDV